MSITQNTPDRFFFPPHLWRKECNHFVSLELPSQKRDIFAHYIMALLGLWRHFHSPWEWYKNIVIALWDIYRKGTFTQKILQLGNNSISGVFFFLHKRQAFLWELLKYSHYKSEDPQRNPSVFLKILGPLCSFYMSQPWLPHVTPLYK